MDQAPPIQLGEFLQRKIVVVLKYGHGTKLFQGEQARAQPVIDIVVVIGDLVGQIRKLRFKAGLLLVEKQLSHIAQPAGIVQ